MIQIQQQIAVPFNSMLRITHSRQFIPRGQSAYNNAAMPRKNHAVYYGLRRGNLMGTI